MAVVVGDRFRVVVAGVDDLLPPVESGESALLAAGRAAEDASDEVDPADARRSLVHLPIHASWLNQIEIYFSIVQRKVLGPNDSTDLADVATRLLAFQDHYEQIATPFEGKFTRADLDRVLVRCDLAKAA